MNTMNAVIELNAAEIGLVAGGTDWNAVYQSAMNSGIEGAITGGIAGGIGGAILGGPGGAVGGYAIGSYGGYVGGLVWGAYSSYSSQNGGYLGDGGNAGGNKNHEQLK